MPQRDDKNVCNLQVIDRIRHYNRSLTKKQQQIRQKPKIQ